MKPEDVPADLINLAHQHYSMHGAGLVANILAAVIPEIQRQEREAEAFEKLDRDRLTTQVNQVRALADELRSGTTTGLLRSTVVAQIDDALRWAPVPSVPSPTPTPDTGAPDEH